MDTLLILFTVTICLNIIIIVKVFFAPRNSSDAGITALDARMDEISGRCARVHG
jgi:hypothetical protein